MSVTSRDVWTALSEHESDHNAVMAKFRSLGGDANRWNIRDKRAMARAITSVEDAVELERGMGGTRDEVTKKPHLRRRLVMRTIRRALEDETDT